MIGRTRLHDNILIEDNVIQGTGDNACGISINNAGNVTVKNNIVSKCRTDMITRDSDVSKVLVKPGVLSSASAPSFDCYRSFHKQLDMTGKFAGEQGITTRCFFASNTINSLGEYYCQYPPIWTGTGQYEWENLDAQINDILKASPDARLICMIDLNTPYWATRRYAMDSYDQVVQGDRAVAGRLRLLFRE